MKPLTLEDIAVLYGVTPITVPALGLPTIGGAPDAPSGRCRADWRITRRDLAELLKIHPDTLTKGLRDGLGAAVVERGRRGSELIFDLRLVFRWWLASEGQLSAVVLEDFRACTRAGVTALSQLPTVGFLLQDAPDDTTPPRCRARQGRRRRA